MGLVCETCLVAEHAPEDLVELADARRVELVATMERDDRLLAHNLVRVVEERDNRRLERREEHVRRCIQEM